MCRSIVSHLFSGSNSPKVIFLGLLRFFETTVNLYQSGQHDILEYMNLKKKYILYKYIVLYLTVWINPYPANVENMVSF